MRTIKNIALLLLVPIFYLNVLCYSQTFDNLNKEQKLRFKAIISKLHNWPQKNAKIAAKDLIKTGNKYKKQIIHTLKFGEPSIKKAMIYCSGKIKLKEAFPVLLKMIYDKKASKFLLNIFEAMIHIDEERAFAEITDFLTKKYYGINPAFKALSIIVNKENVTKLAKLLNVSYYKIRRNTLKLIAQVNSPKIFPVLIHSLKDESPFVTKQAMLLMGKINSYKLRTDLLKQLDQSSGRFRAYLILTIVSQEDNFGITLLRDSFVPELLKMFRNTDYFIKGAAAIALINVNTLINDKKISTLLDKYLVPTLIEVLSGRKYFRDYLSIREIAYNKLVQLTGKNFGMDMVHWWK